MTSCTGSQEVQQLWQTDAFFNIKKPSYASSFSTIPLTISSSLIIFFNNSACDFVPSGEPRKITSSFFGVLIPGQSFWKDAKIVDRRFSVMSPRKKLHFLGLILSPSETELYDLNRSSQFKSLKDKRSSRLRARERRRITAIP